MTPDSEHALRAAIDRLTVSLDRRDDLRRSGAGSSATNVFNINAGGIASLLAVAMAALALVMQFSGQQKQLAVDGEQNDDTRELRAGVVRTQDYLNALYRQYPELRPELIHKAKEAPKP